MPTQEIQTVTKETQKVVLKAICENPTLTVEEIALLLQNRGKKVSQEEIFQVLHSISPNKNWHRATQEDIQNEILDYLWTLEAQVLFILPTKQKETTIAEFNQLRLQNKQPKAPKDIIRHLQTLLLVEGKNLAKFRKFQKDLVLQNDLDINTQAMWAIKIVLANLKTNSITSIQELSTLLASEFKEKFSLISEKVGKTIQRICERFVEKYFPKNITDTKLKELVIKYQSIYNSYRKKSDGGTIVQSELNDQQKLAQKIIEALNEVKEIVQESHEGGFLSKLFTGKIKNKEGVIKRIDAVIGLIDQLNELNNTTNRTINEKILLVQKLQSDYENILLVKSQLENDLYSLNEKLTSLEEKSSNMGKELHDKTESLEKAHEKIASLQQKIDTIPEIESKTNLLRDELNTAKDISIRLYQRINRLKVDLLKQNNDNLKNHKSNGQKNNSVNFHKIQPSQATTQTISNQEQIST